MFKIYLLFLIFGIVTGLIIHSRTDDTNLVSLFSRKQQHSQEQEMQLILDMLRNKKHINLDEVRNHMDISKWKARTHLSKLESRGLVAVEGEDDNRLYMRNW